MSCPSCGGASTYWSREMSESFRIMTLDGPGLYSPDLKNVAWGGSRKIFMGWHEGRMSVDQRKSVSSKTGLFLSSLIHTHHTLEVKLVSVANAN